jgi:hypothetical protein
LIFLVLSGFEGLPSRGSRMFWNPVAEINKVEGKLLVGRVTPGGNDGFWSQEL